MSFCRQQKSRIKESFGIKDFEAQFIHIRIFGGGGAGISFKEAMVWIGGGAHCVPILGAGSLDQFRIRSRIRIRIRMDTYMERDQFTGNGNHRRGSQPQPRIPPTKPQLKDT
ncbi:hypothetical protein QQF64_017221 [Cirrhinus molitorella]|uniref:Uncharacterized protein n=2 Tax=Cirrhinus molitorella TaxID=172907 RepID=A0ABR3LM31_9TELE